MYLANSNLGLILLQPKAPPCAISQIETSTKSKGLPGGTSGKEPTCQCSRHETRVQSLGQEDLLEEGMTTHSSILACRIPWTE